MKKLFTMLVATVCATMAYAQEVTVKDVTMSAGETPNMEVSISNVNQYTAFQFDLALPTGFSVKNASLSGTTATTRKLEKALYDEATNKWRFLSYDEGNAKLAEGTTVNITLEAADGAEGGDVAGSEILVVTPEAVSTAQASASAKITISGEVTAKISSAKQAIFCSDKNLDFSSVSGVKAFIVTGYDKVKGTIWLSQVKEVPANTAVLLEGEAGEYQIPVLSSGTNIYKNMLVGTMTATTVNQVGEGITNYILSVKDGVVGFYLAKESGSSIKAGGGYLPLPTAIEAVGTEGSKETIPMNKYGMLCYYTDQSLDFSGFDDLKAYTAYGYDKKGTIRLTRAMKVPANTAVLLLAPAEKKDYEVPTVSLQQVYSNMLVGSLTSTTINKEADGMINYYVSVVGGEVGFYLASESGTNIQAKRGWLPVPKEMTAFATSRGDGSHGLSVSLSNDIITMSLNNIAGDDDNATGISRVAAEAGNDTWYNLNGQRIDTPTKKGLYIKNGKKVIVK